MLNAALRAELGRVVVDLAGCTAVVADREVVADDPATLEHKLAAELYAVLHAGLGTSRGSARNRVLERALADAVPHRTTPVSGVLLGERPDDLLVEWDGVRVWVPRRIAVDVPPQVGGEVHLAVPPVRPALSPGFQFVGGSRAADFNGPLLRVYVHLTDAACAVRVWRAVLQRLEEEEAGYQAKILSRSEDYPRRDALVVYLPCAPDPAAPGAEAVADAVAALGGVGESTSVFAQRLAPGVARAWEPVDQRLGMTGLSFGQHRAKVVAAALLDSARTGAPAADVVAKAFVEARVDPLDPARNL